MDVVIKRSELNLDHYSIELLKTYGEKQVIRVSLYVWALSHLCYLKSSLQISDHARPSSIFI